MLLNSHGVQKSIAIATHLQSPSTAMVHTVVHKQPSPTLGY